MCADFPETLFFHFLDRAHPDFCFLFPNVEPNVAPTLDPLKNGCREKEPRKDHRRGDLREKEPGKDLSDDYYSGDDYSDNFNDDDDYGDDYSEYDNNHCRRRGRGNK
jgi:hypothetical protein